MHFNNKFDLDNYLKQNTINYLAGGRKSNIFFMDNTKCLKLFNEVIYNDSVVKLIQKKNLNGFYEIYDLLYFNNTFIGYIMKYYKDNNIDILTMPVEYTLDNYNDLYKSIMTLTDKKVFLYDLCNDNAILTDDKLIVIDVDEFIVYKDADKYIVQNENMFALESLFNSIYINARNKYHADDRININRINNIFCINSPHKVLKKYKYPIDYLRGGKYDN